MKSLPLSPVARVPGGKALVAALEVASHAGHQLLGLLGRSGRHLGQEFFGRRAAQNRCRSASMKDVHLT